MRHPHTTAAVLAATVGMLALTGCEATTSGVSGAAGSSVGAPSEGPAGALSEVPTGSPTATSPVPPVATGGSRINAAGAVLPDPVRTPGAINPAVTQATISQTICLTGWTSTVRPPSSVTTRIKTQQLGSGYAFAGDTVTGNYEEDHLISLELGGAPSLETNLWPEPYNTPRGARVKDVVESALHARVCDGTLPLATAQHAIATDWWTAYLTYVDAAPPLAPAPAPDPDPAG